MSFIESNRERAIGVKSFVIDFTILTAIFFSIWFVIDVGVDSIRDWYLGDQTLNKQVLIDYFYKDLTVGSALSLITTSINHFYYKKSFISTRKK